MFFKKSISKFSPPDAEKQTQKLKEYIENADVIVIGAGSGLSTAAGYDYDGERFKKYFAEFEKEYGFSDMYSGGFYPYSSLEEYWAFWSVYVKINRYENPPIPIYERLLSLVKDKNYFVITTNVDHCFQKAGFDKKRLFYTQGDYGLFQCSKPCRKQTYDNEDAITRMVEQREGLRIPSALIPKCPVCGAPMAMNLRVDGSFVEDEGWREASERYDAFLNQSQDKRVLFWEIGVGFNTPSIIKYPFWKMTAQNPKAAYACVNAEEVFCPYEEIADRSALIKADVKQVLKTLLNE